MHTQIYTSSIQTKNPTNVGLDVMAIFIFKFRYRGIGYKGLQVLRKNQTKAEAAACRPDRAAIGNPTEVVAAVPATAAKNAIFT